MVPMKSAPAEQQTCCQRLEQRRRPRSAGGSLTTSRWRANEGKKEGILPCLLVLHLIGDIIWRDVTKLLWFGSTKLNSHELEMVALPNLTHLIKANYGNNEKAPLLIGPGFKVA